MDQDTVDKSRKLLDQQAEAMRRGGKTATFTADQFKVLQKAYKDLESAADSITKKSENLSAALITVSEAFDAPVEQFRKLMDTGVSSGEHLLQTFGALAGLAFEGPIKSATDELKNLEDQLNQIPANALESPDVMKGLEERLKKEQELCKDKSKCNEDEVKNLQNQLKMEGDKLKEGKKLTSEDLAQNKLNDEKRNKIKDQIGKAKEHLDKQKDLAKVTKEFIATFSSAFDRFVQLDKAAAEFRHELGLSRDNARALEQTALQLNQQFATLGITIEKAYQSMVALGRTFGTSLLINKELAQTTSLLAANYGVSEGNAAGFLQKMRAIGGMTDKQASAMAGFTANLANAAGVKVDEVMQDVANASDETLTLMRGNVKQMTLAAVQARMMGVSLDKSAASAKGLLNFTQSVGDEMEASVLLGKNLNLNAARQLSFQGDVAGAQKEILKQVRQMGDFNKMNVFQQEALAKATGYSVADLTKMVSNEEKLAQLSEKDRKALEKAQEALKEQNVETGKQLLMRTQMQSAMSQLSNTFTTFKQILADILTPVVNVAVKLLIPVLKLALVLFNFMLIPVKVLANALYKMWEPIEPFVQKISDSLDGANARIEKIVQGATDFGVILTKISVAINFGVLKPFSLVFGMVGSLGSKLSTIGGIFGLITKPIGFILSFISNIGNGLVSLISKAGSLRSVFEETITVFKKIESFATGLLKPVKGLVTFFGSAAGTVGKFASGFGKFGQVFKILNTAGKAIPFVGQLLTIIQAVWGFFSRVMGGMGVFKALGETLYDVFIGPFEMLFQLLGKIPVIGVVFQQISKIFPIIKKAIDDVFNIFAKGWDAIKNLFSGKDIGKNLVAIGKMYLASILFVPTIVFKALMAIFPKIIDGLKSIFTLDNLKTALSVIFFMPMLIVKGLMAVVPMIWTAIKGLGSMLYNILIQPWVNLWNFVSNLFVGRSNSTLGDGIIKGLIGVGTAILSIFTKPFEFIFDLIMKGFSSIGSFIQNVLSVPFKIVGKLIGVDTGGIGGGGAGGGNQSDMVAAIERTNQKLDTLISLMTNGGIAINLDGRKVSEQLAIASS